jgi:hypothetical protein
MQVNETLRRVVSKDGTELKLHNVTDVDTSGSWLRLQCDEGYVIINPANVLAFIIKGDKVF